MSWRPNAPVPREFMDVLRDEESEGEDDFLLEEEEEMNIFDMPVYLERGDGTLSPLQPGPVGEGDGEISDYLNHGGDSEITGEISNNPPPEEFDSSDDEEVERARNNMRAAISPITTSSSPRQRSLSPRFRVEVIAVPSSSRGGTATRGRGRGGRGRGRGRGLVERGNGGWARGNPLQERYVTDEEIPEPIRQEICRILRVRTNARSVREDERNEVDDVDDADDWNDAEEFAWRNANEFRGEREPFLPQETGPTSLIDNGYDALKSIWTDDIMNHIVDETNRYAQSLVARRARFAREWFATTVDEIWTLFAFWMMLGIIRMPTIKSCFTQIPILRTDVFRMLFSEVRYWNLNAAFHLQEGTDANEPLHPMGPIISHLNNRFQELYRLDQEVCIDESLTLWKGPVGFKQYIRTKAAKFGIKTYQLCESATGYLYHFFVYTGVTTNLSLPGFPTNLPSSVKTVLFLIKPLLNLGYTLFMDNWFNSPTLARWLKRHKTDCVGTLRANRKQVPLPVQKCPLAEGQFIARACDDVMVLSVQDRNRVTCLSTYHNVSQIQKPAKPGRPAQYKLQLIEDYNRGMGGVDRLDQMLEAYLVERKQCKKWNLKLFKRLLNISLQNSRIIVEKSTNTKIDSLAFRLSIVEEIIKRHLPSTPRGSAAPQQRRRHQNFPITRLTERHFIRRIPITDEMRQRIRHRTSLGRRQCVLCNVNGKQIKTVYECAECGMALCLDDCFKKFHTEP